MLRLVATQNLFMVMWNTTSQPENKKKTTWKRITTRMVFCYSETAADLAATEGIEYVMLGVGGTSVVYRCRSVGNGELWAVKSPSSAAGRQSAMGLDAYNKFQQHRQLRHENVVACFALGWNGSVFMEWVAGGSLADVIACSGALVETRVLYVAKQVLMGLSYLHQNGIIHRDLKPANILIDTHTDTVKLCDWIGEVEAAEACKRAFCVVGTPVFLAPEAVRQGMYSCCSDTWAFGCTVLNLLTGALPWSDEDNVFAAMYKTAHGQAPPHPQRHLLRCQLLGDLLALSFQQDANQRPAPDVLLAMLFTCTPTTPKQGKRTKAPRSPSGAF